MFCTCRDWLQKDIENLEDAETELTMLDDDDEGFLVPYLFV